MKQIVTLGYTLKEDAPLYLAFLSHEPLNFKQEVEVNGSSYLVRAIERVSVFSTPSMKMFASNTLNAPSKRLTAFCVKDIDEVLNSIELELGENEMFLHIVDIKG